MIDQPVLLQSTISEYDSAVSSASRSAAARGQPDRLTTILSKEHGWTDEGAHTIISLANDYGAFMLRNALAIAVVLDKEDGDLGF